MSDLHDRLEPLYVIADCACAAGAGRNVVEAVDRSLKGGARFFQLRDKEGPVIETWEYGRRVAALCSEPGADLLVNDRADLAVSLNAAGVHRPWRGLPLSAIRQVCGQDALVGVSTHGRDELDAAVGAGADFVTLSPVFEVTSKPDAGEPLGVERFGQMARSVDIPVFALGGITPERVEACMEAGAFGVAVMSGIVAADDPEEATRSYLEVLSDLSF